MFFDLIVRSSYESSQSWFGQEIQDNLNVHVHATFATLGVKEIPVELSCSFVSWLHADARLEPEPERGELGLWIRTWTANRSPVQ